jgi:hypothetical protein
MSKISVNTVIRANNRTIQQYRSKQIQDCSSSVQIEEMSVSVSVMGVVHSQTITLKEIKESFKRSINIHVKKL